MQYTKINKHEVTMKNDTDIKSQNFLAELTAKEKKLQTLIDKKFLVRDLFFALVIYCALNKLLSLFSSDLFFNSGFSLVTAPALMTSLRRRIYKDRLKNVQRKIIKLSQNK